MTRTVVPGETKPLDPLEGLAAWLNAIKSASRVSPPAKLDSDRASSNVLAVLQLLEAIYTPAEFGPTGTLHEH